MDDRRFDHLARLAATGSRRDCLRSALAGLVTALFARPLASASQLEGTIVLGGVCATSSECRQQDMHGEAFCADNGFASDGDYTCCAESGCCSSDADCCGDLRCAPTHDVCYICRQPPLPTRSLGQECVADSDCVLSPRPVRCLEGRCNFVEDGAWTPPPEGWILPDIPETEAALAAAETFSRLEAAGQFETLYERMHPDAQRVVPREVVIGWYRHEFAPRGPEAAEAVKVRVGPWTWEVTGQDYPDTATVAYRQRFADGTEARGDVRLAKNWNGNWSWFFGRDRAFVEEQMVRFAAAPGTPGP